MATPSIKDKIIQTVRDLPSDATIEDAMERLYFLAKIERGLAQSRSGQTLSHNEVKKIFTK